MRISRFGFQTLLFCVVVIALFVFSGYDHTVEIQDRLLCHALGIDFSDGEYHVSVQAFKPSGAGADTPVDITKSNIELVYGKGRTVSEALEECENERGKDIFLGHLQLICFGKSVDFSNSQRLCEFCLKDRTVYLGVDICLSATTARELLEVELSNDMLATENYVAVIEKNAEKSRTVRCRLLDLLNMSKGSRSAALPVLKVIKPPEDKKELAESVLQVAETAMIKDGRVLEKSLDCDHSQGFLLLLSSSQQADMVLDSDDGRISVRIDRNDVDTSVEQGSGVLLYKAHLTVVVHKLKDFMNGYDPDTVRKLVKQYLTQQFDMSFRMCVNEEKVDITGIWKLLRLKYPKTYLEYEDRLDEVFENAQGMLEIECLVE